MALPAPCNNWICEFNEDDIAEWLINTPVTCVTCTYNSVIYPPGAIKDCRRQPTGLLTDACYNEVCMPPVTMTGTGTWTKVGLNAMDVDIFSIQQPPRRRRQPPQPQRQLQPQPQLQP